MIRSVLTRASLIPILACPAACVPALSSQITRTGPSIPARPADAPVALFFRTVALPEWPYLEIGQIRVDSTAPLPEVLGEAEARARQLGADAIIVDLRYHYQSLPVSFDASGAPQVPGMPRLNANVIAISFGSNPPPPSTAPAQHGGISRGTIDGVESR